MNTHLTTYGLYIIYVFFEYELRREFSMRRSNPDYRISVSWKYVY